MNSKCGRLNKHSLIFFICLSFFSPLSQSNETGSALPTVTLEQYIRDSVLSQWQTIGQRSGATNKIIISGIPDGYKTPDCQSPLSVKPRNTLRLGRNSIEVSCQHRASWSLMLNADIEVWRDVVVLRDHLPRGQRVKSTNITLQQRNIGDLQRGYYTDLEDIIGNVSKRSLKAGTAISPSMIDLPIIIKRGQAVTLKAERPGFSVNMNGIALKKGRKGDRIKVKNSNSNKVLYGRVAGSDLVLID